MKTLPIMALRSSCSSSVPEMNTYFSRIIIPFQIPRILLFISSPVLSLLYSAVHDICIMHYQEAYYWARSQTILSIRTSCVNLLTFCLVEYFPTQLTLTDCSETNLHSKGSRLISNLHFVQSDTKLNFYTPGNPLHSWYTNSCNPNAGCGPIWPNSAIVQVDSNLFEEHAISMPFYAAHSRDIRDDSRPAPYCRTSYLAIGTSKDSIQSDGFIVQAEWEILARHCDHVALTERGRRTGHGWKAIALLAGWRQGKSSLGTVSSISPLGTRIAAATWSRLLVWAFNPDLLHQGALELYFPKRDYNSRKGMGRLRPVRLRSEGVIHSLFWANETTLYAATDEGLVRWDMGHKSSGERENLSLAFDAWPANVVAM